MLTGSAQVAATLAMAETRASRWYFGGLASCGAACCTHPLDLLKVRLSLKAERLREPQALERSLGLAPIAVAAPLRTR